MFPNGARIKWKHFNEDKLPLKGEPAGALHLKLLLVILTPPHDGHLKTALNLSEAALGKGHGVIVFMTGDGALHAAQDMAESMTLKMKQLVERGMQLVACRESLRQKGPSP